MPVTHLRSGHLLQDRANKGAAISDGINGDLYIALVYEPIERRLHPRDGDWLTAGRLLRAYHNVVASDPQDRVRSACQCLDRPSLELVQ